MKYKNLNSLGRAYRDGEVNRSGYIRQRRDLIDAITSRQPISAGGAEQTSDGTEHTTVISDADSLSANSDDEEGDRPCRRYLDCLDFAAQSPPPDLSLT